MAGEGAHDAWRGSWCWVGRDDDCRECSAVAHLRRMDAVSPSELNDQMDLSQDEAACGVLLDECR